MSIVYYPMGMSTRTTQTTVVPVLTGNGAPPSNLGRVGQLYNRLDGSLPLQLIYRKTSLTVWVGIV